jgi:cobalt-zinc-cadmium efflux system protein
VSHHHHHHHDHTSKNLGSAFLLNLVFAIIELIGGLFTNSVAILSDALHDFGDSLTLGLSWYFSKLSNKHRNEEFTYGYKRFNVVGAIISSIVLLTGSIFIVVETIPRLTNPVRPDTQGMIILGILGVIINGIAAFRLQKGHSITERAVYLHLLEDVLGWVATLIGAIVMHYTDIIIIDALLSILIAVFILFNVFKNLKQGFNIILQGTPSNLAINKVHAAVSETRGVLGFHDCRAWTLDGREHILSIHLIVKESSLSEIEAIKKEVRSKLLPLGVKHSTLEIEVEGADCEVC